MKFLKRVNKQVKRTRDWVFNALLSLLDEKKYEDIKISNIADKAGVARQTFYRNYDGKDDIISKFIGEMVAEYLEKLESDPPGDEEGMWLLFFEIMALHREELLKMKDASILHLLFSGFWEQSNSMLDAYFDEKDLPEEKKPFIRYQLGGLIALAVDWIFCDMDPPPAVEAARLNSITSPFRDDPFSLSALISNVGKK